MQEQHPACFTIQVRIKDNATSKTASPSIHQTHSIAMANSSEVLAQTYMKPTRKFRQSFPKRKTKKKMVYLAKWRMFVIFLNQNDGVASHTFMTHSLCQWK